MQTGRRCCGDSTGYARVCLAAFRLPDIHNDPFDRILIAEALERGMILVSKDKTIARYPDVRVVW
jgi:PIN domain nuclease of toxin-antitoxin system